VLRALRGGWFDELLDPTDGAVRYEIVHITALFECSRGGIYYLQRIS